MRMFAWFGIVVITPLFYVNKLYDFCPAPLSHPFHSSTEPEASRVIEGVRLELGGKDIPGPEGCQSFGVGEAVNKK